jgi:hypothetical protein
VSRARLLAVALAVAALTGCGGGSGGHATVWVTRDEGRQVLIVKQVPSGLTAMQALERVAKVDTRYGGRFVESIDGVSGSLSKQRDWFYFVNGIEADRGASEYRLHPGDLEWWDYRSWSNGREHVPVVVGAFPEPFLHGYGGKKRPAVVVGSGPGARALARLLHGRVVAGDPPRDANVLRLVPGGAPRFTAGERLGGAVELDFSGNALRLARRPSLYRYRYEVP